MKTFLNVIGALALMVVLVFNTLNADGAEVPTVPEMPTEVTLTTGRVLRKVQVIRWESNRVVLKHSAGADPIAFSLIAQPDRDRVIAWRDEQMKPASLRQAAATITGQIYVTTRGAGAYKFSGVTVFAYPLSLFDNLAAAQRTRVPSSSGRYGVSRNLREAEAWQSVLTSVKPIASATTNADGGFVLRLFTKEAVFLHCMADRSLGEEHEINLWALPVSGDQIALNQDNTWTGSR